MATLTAITDGIDTEDWADLINAYVAQQNAIFQYLVAGDLASGLVSLTLENSWVNFGSGFANAACFKGPDSMIYTLGLVKDGTTTPNTTILTYPSGYRPAAALRFATVSNGAFGWGQISSLGPLTIQSGSATYFSLFIPPFRAA